MHISVSSKKRKEKKKEGKTRTEKSYLDKSF